MKSKYIPILISCLFAIIVAQDLEDLSFGDEHSLDIATWNIEWFPKNNQITVDYVIEIVNLLEFDILGIQELDDTTMFNEMLDSLPSYSGYYESSWFAGLAYIYRTDLVEINDIFEIYTSSPYWNAFPRSPMVMDLNFEGENYIIINNHLKCCGDGLLDLNNESDEENRRYTAMNLLKAYIDENLSNEKVIVLGDLNDDISESYPNNVFQDVINDSNNYQFVDLSIAQGNSSEWSFPNWPSHLDHILITNELFEGVDSIVANTIKIDDYMNGGWIEYDQNISDHRPVAMKIHLDYELSFDLNNDGIFDNSDIIMLISIIFEQDNNQFVGDVNLDSTIDIFDLLLLSDYLYAE